MKHRSGLERGYNLRDKSDPSMYIFQPQYYKNENLRKL